MTQINLHEAKSRFAHYTRMIKAGETIILCDRNKPFAEIRPLAPAKNRKPMTFGLMKGLLTCPDDFNDPLPELEEAMEKSPTLCMKAFPLYPPIP